MVQHLVFVCSHHPVFIESRENAIRHRILNMANLIDLEVGGYNESINGEDTLQKKDFYWCWSYY